MLISPFSYEIESKIEEMKLGKTGEMDTRQSDNSFQVKDTGGSKPLRVKKEWFFFFIMEKKAFRNVGWFIIIHT